MLPTVSEALPSKTSFTVPWIQKCKTTFHRLSALPHKELGIHGHKDRRWCGDVVMRKLKGTDFFPTIGTLQVRTGSAALRQWPKAMAQFLCAQCRQRGRLCPEGWAAAHTTLSFCSFSADIMQLQLLSMETERLPMVTHVQVTARKRKHMLYSSCPCANSECEYGCSTENLGLKNSPSTDRAVVGIYSSGAERKVTAQRYPKTVQQSLCTTSAPSTHTAQHTGFPSPFPPRYKPAFCCVKEKEGSKLRRNALSPVLSGNAEWEKEYEASSEILLCNNWLTSPWKLYKVSFHSCLPSDGQVQAVRQECRKKLLAFQTV